VPFLKIAAYAPADVGALSLGLVGEIFSPRPGLPPFQLTVCTDRPGPVRTDLGLTVHIGAGLTAATDADLVLALPGANFRAAPTPQALDTFREAHGRGAFVAGSCVGAYLLAAAGLLDGRRATTHWRFAALLAERHPAVTVDAGVLYVDEGRVLTGAGAAAGADLCLHLIRREHGAAVANAIARDMVIPPHRAGGQAQYVAAPVPDGDDRLGVVLDWARAHLHRRLGIDELAGRALLSRRTFIRAFKAATGTTPNAWLVAERLHRAEQLLETTALPVEEIARQVGYAGAAVLREQFVARRGIPPQAYRRAFTHARSAGR
jgi:transcriptional regulator GlxA family with amidase domain